MPFGNQERVSITNLPRDVKKDDVLLLNDGLIVLIVERVVGNEIHTITKIGGELSNNKGINRQGGGLTAPLTAKDMEDIKTAMSFQADYLAISFPKMRPIWKWRASWRTLPVSLMVTSQC